MSLPPFDLTVLGLYLLGVAGLGLAFARRSRTPAGFTTASGRLPGWAVGLSIFGTFLSSNTFLGVPGKAFASDWNSFVFSLSLPVAAFVAVRWFVPFHRGSGSVSAFEHLERRFGRWARTYALICYVLTQLARVGSILFGVSIALGAFTGWGPVPIILAAGFVVTVYTVVGGIEAVIWTDVVQSVVLTLGVIVVLVALLGGMPGGLETVADVARQDGKMSLGGFGWDLSQSTFWVVLFYGLFINLNNFGIDQSYVQRYHAAVDERAAKRSVWLAAWLYLPISLLFFFLGTALYAFYTSQPAQLSQLTTEVASLRGLADNSTLEVADLGDRAFPNFIVGFLPPGVAGLILAALLAAAMSSVDTSLNSSATVLHEDLVRPYIPGMESRVGQMGVLRSATCLVGVLGTLVALAMINVSSVLDAWWTLSGIFAGGVLGLFLLGLLSRSAARADAVAGVVAGVLVIGWMTLSPRLPAELGALRSALHSNLIVVVGTLTVFGVGAAAARATSSKE